MDETLVNSIIRSENQLFFINNERVIGLQNINPVNNFNIKPLNYAGFGNGNTRKISYIPAGEQNNVSSINSLLINQDFFYSKVLSNNYYNAYLFNDINNLNNNYCLLNGYFTDYSLKYSIGNIPQISTNFISLGNMLS